MTRVLLALALTLATVSPAAAQGFAFPLPTGLFKSCGDNEVCLYEFQIPDPPKVRIGALLGNGFGTVSFDRLRMDGVPIEAALLYCKQDERYPAHIVVGYCELFLKDASGDDDGAMKRKVTFYHDRVVLHVPLVFPNGASIGSRDHLEAGRYTQYLQTDGNSVVYETVDGTPCPRWALNWIGSYYRGGAGWVDPAVLSAPCH